MQRAAAPGLATRIASGLALLAVGSAAATAVGLAVLSLRWPLVHDLPIFLYDGFLMSDLGRVPYRDFYEINAPGTLLLYSYMHQWTQGAALPLRLLDLGVLSGISICTIVALRSHGLLSGTLAASCFAMAYLARGPMHSLQREYLAVLPLALSAALAFRRDSFASSGAAMATIGLMAGLVVPVKPLLAICWLPFPVLGLVSRRRADPVGWSVARWLKAGASISVPFLLGMSLIPLVTALWLARNGALDAYLDIARNYYPLYTQLQGNASTWHGSFAEAVQRYVSNPLDLIPTFPFAILAFLGVAAASTYRDRPAFLQVLAICALAVCAIGYVALSGKFWVYHRFPLFYGLALLAGLAVSREMRTVQNGYSWRIAIICVAVAVGLPLNVAGREAIDWSEGRTFIVKDGRVDLVADYLEQHVGPTETVMALDVTSGALHGLYRNRRPLYGRFIYDHHFYHHTSHPYIQGLRRELLGQFRDGEPDVVVRADDTWLRIPDFPELDAILNRDYEVALQAKQISILRRRSAASQRPPVGQ